MGKPKFFATVGRISLTLGVLALVGAWIATQKGALFGLSETHLFSDAIVFSLLGIAALIDANLHSKNI